MIYTKGKAGYHMEKSDILTASLPDANDETTDHSTIFFIMFVPQLFKMFFFTVRSVEYFIDQRNQKLWHFLSNCSENIIKNGAVIGCFIVVTKKGSTQQSWGAFRSYITIGIKIS